MPFFNRIFGNFFTLAVRVGPGIRLGKSRMGITCIETVILVPTRDVGGTLLNRIGRREEVMRFFF
jgi:hypothetical protein